MSPQIDLGTLVAHVDANTKAYERAMLKMEVLTSAVMKDIERKNNTTSKSVDRLTDAFNRTKKQVVGLKVSMLGLKFAGYTTAALAAAQGITALGGAAVVAAQSLAPLSGALAGMPFLLGAAGQGVITLTLGTKDLTKAMAAAGDETKFNEAIKELDPATRKAAVALRGMRDEFKEIKAAAAAGLLPGLTSALKEAANNSGLLKDALYSTGQVLGSVFEKFGKYIGSDAFGKMFKELSGRGATGFKLAGDSALKFFDAITRLTVAAKPLTDLFFQGIEALGNWMQKMTESGLETGRFAAFIDTTVTTIQRWVAILGNLGSSIWNVFKAANPAAQAFLGWLQGASGKLKEWTSSTEGMKKLSDFFANISKPIGALGEGLGKIAVSLKGLFEAQGMNALADLLTHLGDGLSMIGENIAPLFVTLEPLMASLVDSIALLASAFVQSLMPAVQIVTPTLTTLIGMLGPNFAALMTNNAESFTYLATALVQIMQALMPVLPMWAEYIAFMSPIQTKAIWAISNAIIGIAKAMIWMAQTSINAARSVMEGFIYPIYDGLDNLFGAAAAAAKALGNEGMGRAFDEAGDRLRGFKDQTVANFNTMNGVLDEMQSRLDYLGNGVTIPLTYTVTYVNTNSLDGIMKASASGKSYAPPKPAKTYGNTWTTGAYNGGGGKSGGGGGGGGGTSAKQQAIDSFKQGMADMQYALAGLTKPTNPVWQAFHSAFDGIWKYLDKGTRKAITKMVKRMAGLYKEHQKLLAEIDKKKSIYEGLKQEKASWASSMKDTMQTYGGLGTAWSSFRSQQQQGDLAAFLPGLGNPAQFMMGQMKSRLAKMKSFFGKIKKLKKMGLSPALLGEVMAAGIDEGSNMADALLASPEMLSEFNKVQAELESYSTKMSNTASGWMYDAGIAAAKGIVDGLESQRKALEAKMKSLAKSMLQAAKDELGIKSPSRKFRDQVGLNTGKGIALGVQDSTAAVIRSIGTLSSDMLASGAHIAAPSSGGVTIASGAVNVAVDARGATDPVAVEAAARRAAQDAFNELLREIGAA